MESGDGASAVEGASRQAVTLNIVSISIYGHKLTFSDMSVITTIAQLKLRIQDALPSKPPPERQRLIFQGRPLLLPDVTLAAVFGAETLKATDTFTIHLALRPDTSGDDPSANGSIHSTRTDSDQRANMARSGGMRGTGRTPSGIAGQDGGLPPLLNPMGLTMAPGGQPSQMPGQMPGQVPGLVPLNLPPGQPQLPHLLMQQLQIEQQIQHLIATQQRLRSQNEQLLATDGPPVQISTQQETRPQESATNNPSSQLQPQNTTGPAHFTQHGQRPLNSWSVSVQQTTIHRPHTAHPPLPQRIGQPQPGPFPVPTSFAPPQGASIPASISNIPPQQGPLPMPPMMGLPQGMFPQFRPPLPQPIQAPIRLPARQPGVASSSHFPNELFLLCSPTGYQALLIPPQGPVTISDNFHMPLSARRSALRGHQGLSRNRRAAYHAAIAAGQPLPPRLRRQQGGVAEIVRILLPLGGHLWLLIRLLGFVYLFTGGATWSRTFLMSGIALIVFVAQAGWLTPLYHAIGEPIRRHVEGLVRPEGVLPARADQVNAGAPQAGQRPGQRDPPGGTAAGPSSASATTLPASTAGPSTAHATGSSAQPSSAAGPSTLTNRASGSASGMASASVQNPTTAPATGGISPNPTPEQVAARLLREREVRDMSTVQAALRRVERGIALFVTSLVPGWGEQHVRAAEAAARERESRENEEEVARERERAEREGLDGGGQEQGTGAAEVQEAGGEQSAGNATSKGKEREEYSEPRGTGPSGSADVTGSVE